MGILCLEYRKTNNLRHSIELNYISYLKIQTIYEDIKIFFPPLNIYVMKLFLFIGGGNLLSSRYQGVILYLGVVIGVY